MKYKIILTEEQLNLLVVSLDLLSAQGGSPLQTQDLTDLMETISNYEEVINE